MGGFSVGGDMLPQCDTTVDTIIYTVKGVLYPPQASHNGVCKQSPHVLDVGVTMVT